MAELPRIPPATNGTEQRLDALLSELRELRGMLTPNQMVKKDEPQPAHSEKQIVDLREPVEVPNKPEPVKEIPKPVINAPKPGSPTPGSVKKQGTR